MPITRDIVFTSGGKAIPAEVHRPVTPGTGGGVILVAYGSDGMENTANGNWETMIREHAIALAKKNFTVLIPDYFARTGTAAGTVTVDTMLLHFTQWEAAVGDAIVAAQALTGINPTRTGLLGFSLGGRLCLSHRASAKALVEFFAPDRPGLPIASACVPQAQIHYGAKDELVLPPESERIAAVLRAEGSAVELRRYAGAGHGFSGTDPSNAAARRTSLSRTLAFFQRHL
jgi:dienelactone hydrolase